MTWDIIFYQKENGEAPVKIFLDSLPQKHRMKAAKEIDLLQYYGPLLGMPYVKKVQGSRYKGICELRIQQGNDISRIFYFIPVGNAFVLLHGFIKKSQKTPTLVYGDNISEKRGKGRDWRGQVWKRPDFRRFCGGTAPVQGRDVAVILRKTASAAVGAFFAPGKAPGGPTSGAAGDDAQAYESPQKRRRQAIPGGLWYKMGRIASSRKSQQQTLEDEPPGP